MRYFAGLLALLVPLAFGKATSPSQASPTASISKEPATTSFLDSRIVFGVYDPHSEFAGDSDVTIEHIFLPWQAFDPESLQQRLQTADQRGRMMMVTVEPYTRALDWRSGGNHLFSDIASGGFDTQIKGICAEVGNFRNHALIRWGHEMEDATGRYPWAREDFAGYKAAYRYFVQHCRQYAPRAAFVWSPKGEKNLAEYYPGDDVVEFVGVAVWGLQKMDVAFYGGGRGFPETFEEKYDRVAIFKKPVIIAELGVSGDPAYRDSWFASLFRAVATSSAFQRLRAVVYFDDKEPYHWPMGFGSPDWRIAPEWFRKAKQALQAQRVGTN